MLKICDDVVVLTTLHGCVEQLVASLVSVNFVELDANALLWNLDLSLREHTKWREVASLVQTIAELTSDPLHNLASVYHTLSIALSLPYKHQNFSHLLNSVSRHTDSENNKKIEPFMLKRIRETVQLLHARLHADARLEGTRWFCDLG